MQIIQNIVCHFYYVCVWLIKMYYHLTFFFVTSRAAISYNFYIQSCKIICFSLKNSCKRIIRISETKATFWVLNTMVTLNYLLWLITCWAQNFDNFRLSINSDLTLPYHLVVAIAIETACYHQFAFKFDNYPFLWTNLYDSLMSSERIWLRLI